MQRRQEEAFHEMLIGGIEEVTGSPFPSDTKEKYMEGADELSLVRSGLDDTMRSAYQEMSEVWNARKAEGVDLRTAAYLISIRKVADSYATLGL